MARFTIDYELTERTTQRIVIEADSLDEAIQTVETYAFDNSHQNQIDSHEWSIANVRGA